MAVRVYVAAIAFLAIVSTAGWAVLEPALPQEYVKAAAFFALLGMFAFFLSYELTRGAYGSIAFIPFLTTAALAPHWISALAVGISVFVVEIATRRPVIKSLFNIAQYVLALNVSVWIYRAFGGQSLTDLDNLSVIAYVALFASFLIANSGFVAGAIGLSEGRRILRVWRERTLPTIQNDLMSLPFVYVFAFVYVRFGTIGAASLALPLLAVRQLYKVNWQLEKVNQELLELMVRAIEARDPYTSGHSRRVAHHSRIIARAVGLHGRQVDRIAIAALLHDVGKIHEVYAPILRKPDKLTPEEWAVMQTHPVKSAQLVETVSHLKDLVAPIRHHHENWDGTGYPDGLSGENIPLGARIIMIADTIDAMTTDRPYRAALGPEQVRTELMRLRGRQFDPQLCDILLASPLFALMFSSSAASGPVPRYTPARLPTRQEHRATG